MILCWDNIENIRLNKNDDFSDIFKKRTYYLSVCKKCNTEFLGKKNGKFCCLSCSISFNGKGKKHSEETKAKISASHKGKKHSEETRIKVKEFWKNRKGFFNGKKHSEETKAKISASHKGKKLSNEHKEKMSIAQKNRYEKNKSTLLGKKLSNEHKEKISNSLKGQKNPFYNKKHSEETKAKMSQIKKGKYSKENHPNWKGGYDDIPLYDTYAYQIEWCEEVRRNKEDPNILEVKCFKCNKWYIPKISSVGNRLQYLKGNYFGNYNFYCSDQCKNSCSIYRKSINTIMKEDAVRAGRLPWLELTREVQPELRSMVLERDEHKCVKCGSTKDLQCHHILPISIEPLLSADIDNCVILCKECHIEVHKKDGCKYSQLNVKEC